MTEAMLEVAHAPAHLRAAVARRLVEVAVDADRSVRHRCESPQLYPRYFFTFAASAWMSSGFRNTARTRPGERWRITESDSAAVGAAVITRTGGGASSAFTEG